MLIVRGLLGHQSSLVVSRNNNYFIVIIMHVEIT